MSYCSDCILGIIRTYKILKLKRAMFCSLLLRFNYLNVWAIVQISVNTIIQTIPYLFIIIRIILEQFFLWIFVISVNIFWLLYVYVFDNLPFLLRYSNYRNESKQKQWTPGQETRNAYQIIKGKLTYNKQHTRTDSLFKKNHAIFWRRIINCVVTKDILLQQVYECMDYRDVQLYFWKLFVIVFLYVNVCLWHVEGFVACKFVHAKLCYNWQ